MTAAPPSPVTAQSNIREFIDVLMAEKWNRAEQCPRDSYNIHDLSTAIVGTPNIPLSSSPYNLAQPSDSPYYSPSSPRDAFFPLPPWLTQNTQL